MLRLRVIGDGSPAALLQAGHDGLIFDDWTVGRVHTTFAIFRPEAIKSATHNSGLYAGESPAFRDPVDAPRPGSRVGQRSRP